MFDTFAVAISDILSWSQDYMRDRKVCIDYLQFIFHITFRMIAALLA